MGTATSRAVTGGIAALALALAACGGQPRAASPPAASGFGWLRPAAVPSSWGAVAISSGAALPIPSGWKRIHGDAGTATVVLLDGTHRIVGYLNLTPRQGLETPANWGHFRIDHNAEEGDRSIRRLAVGTGLEFRSGRGSCVRDSYTTGSGSRYVELACLVKGRTASTVIVGASPPAAWGQLAPTLERAISSFTT
jgi:hypothetical protein